MANATFLAQQQIDWLRGFTLDELEAYAGTSLESRDEVLDLNLDGTNDFRRITGIPRPTAIRSKSSSMSIPPRRSAVPSPAALLADPEQYPPRALISTIITR